MEATTLESIVKSATTTPILFDDNEEEFLPLENQPNTNPTPQTIVDPIPETTNPPAPLASNPTPEDQIPQCLSHIAEKPAVQGPSCLERAIWESADAASRLKTAHMECKKTLQDL